MITATNKLRRWFSMNSIPLSISEEMHLLAQQLQQHFSSTQLEELARQAGFVQRKSKYCGCAGKFNNACHDSEPLRQSPVLEALNMHLGACNFS